MPFYNSNSHFYCSPPPSPLLDPAPLYESKKSHTCHRENDHASTSFEDVRQFDTSPDASRASCKFANSGLRAVDVTKMELYRRSVPGSDGNVVIGVGYRSSSGEIMPLVLIENSDEGRGIHFTGCLAHDSSRSLVACLRLSARLHPVFRHIIYLDYLRNLQNRSPMFIWDWWRSGVDMDRLDKQIKEGQ